MTEFFAILVAALFLVGFVFQASLVAGAPLGDYAFGGRAPTSQGRLPTMWRVASGVVMLVQVGFAWIILARAGVVTSSVDETVLTVLAWMVVAVMTTNTVGNIAAKTAVEKYVFGLSTAVTAVGSAIVAATGPS